MDREDEILRALGRLEGKMDGLYDYVGAVNASVKENKKDADASEKDFGVRLGSLEKRAYALSIGLGLFGAWAADAIRKIF